MAVGLVVDETYLFRELLKEFLESQGHTISTVGSIAAVAELKGMRPDFILWNCSRDCDCDIPSRMLDNWPASMPSPKFLLLLEDDGATKFRAWQAQTRSRHAQSWQVLPRNVPARALPHLVALALLEIPLPQGRSRALAAPPQWCKDAAQVPSRRPVCEQPEILVPTDGKLERLSDRERQILAGLMKGLSNKVIGRNLDIAEGTVKVHVKHVLKKIDARNRTQAAIWARNHLRDAATAIPVRASVASRIPQPGS